MLLFMASRKCSRAMSAQLDTWSSSHQGAWGDAVKGIGAVQAGLDRLARDDIAVELGEKVASIFWDLEEFFDSIALVVLMERALNLKYRPALLSLTVNMYMSIRALRVRKACSGWISPIRSICAGCAKLVC